MNTIEALCGGHGAGVGVQASAPPAPHSQHNCVTVLGYERTRTQGWGRGAGFPKEERFFPTVTPPPQKKSPKLVFLLKLIVDDQS